jgi:predicted Rossmann fold nucleotide-binding protein DprA/Smf involved in DNA uptake
MEIFQLKQSSADYPSTLQKYLGRQVPRTIMGLDNLDHLKQKKLAFFCSVRCPGHLILKTYDLAQQLKERGVTVVSGFHSPVERECFRILLQGTQPIIVCPARTLKGMRLKAEYKKPIEDGRLLLLSPFKESKKRNSLETSTERNRFVAALADSIFVAYASANSKTEKFCREVLEWGKPLYTFESDSNKTIVNLGAKVFSINGIDSLKQGSSI